MIRFVGIGSSNLTYYRAQLKHGCRELLGRRCRRACCAECKVCRACCSGACQEAI